MSNRICRICSELFILVNVLVVFSSCIREDDLKECTYDFMLDVSLRDREYSNINELPSFLSRAASPAFRDYVSQFGFQLNGINSSRDLPYMQVQDISATDSTLSVPISRFYEGEYQIVSWGNYLPGVSTDLGYILHGGAQDDADVFFCSDTIAYTQDTLTRKCYLHRLKGKLVTYVENLPDSILAVDVNITTIYGYWNNEYQYGEVGDYTKTYYSTLQDLTILETSVAPSPKGQKSGVVYTFYSRATGEPFHVTPMIDITITENEISVLRIKFLAEEDDTEVALWIDGDWKGTHDMTLTSDN